MLDQKTIINNARAKKLREKELGGKDYNPISMVKINNDLIKWEKNVNYLNIDYCKFKKNKFFIFFLKLEEF